MQTTITQSQIIVVVKQSAIDLYIQGSHYQFSLVRIVLASKGSWNYTGNASFHQVDKCCELAGHNCSVFMNRTLSCNITPIPNRADFDYQLDSS